MAAKVMVTRRLPPVCGEPRILARRLKNEQPLTPAQAEEPHNHLGRHVSISATPVYTVHGETEHQFPSQQAR